MSRGLASDYPAWKKLQQLYNLECSNLILKDLFAQDPAHFSKFSKEYVSPDDPSVTFLLNYSKNLITKPVLDTLLSLVKEAEVESYQDKMFYGEHIDTSEDRAVLHVTLQNFGDFKITEDDVNEVDSVLEIVKVFLEAVRKGDHKEDTGKTIDTIVNMTFTTLETITNTESTRDCFLTSAKDKSHIAKHFVTLSTNTKAVTEFGIAKENILWSTIGLSIALVVGYDNFEKLLKGVHGMDFKEMPLMNNLPILLAVIGIWYNDFYGSQTHCLLPYDQYLHKFANYFQQGDMESNGKFVTKGGQHPIIWGAAATNSQHSFYQLIHQGTKLIPCDFITPCTMHNPIAHSNTTTSFPMLPILMWVPLIFRTSVYEHKIFVQGVISTHLVRSLHFHG
ncbi:hypothetical protein JAAARDRAFT_61944 [Jaapia argillacea MUCL 33604]|uniref:Uncharacterized protein n=1 Tax=Jaapia argillacea MUCL 33604 TaxID=933084 RepID=A0A067PM85_9AGAM|nr:hypothetical protein JAAARDRAFT_61944 [Jaapia argillacea MUCL 33604]